MSEDRLPALLKEMRRACIDGLEFISGMSKETYRSDSKTQNATVMTLIRLGESAVQVMESSPEFVAAHSSWPWQEMRAMRNRGAHAYGTIVFEVVWSTLSDLVPRVLAEIEAVDLDELR